jgi:hypothetical protein
MLRRTKIYGINEWTKRLRRFRAREHGCETAVKLGTDRLRVADPGDAISAAPTARMTAMEDTPTTRTVSSTKQSTKPTSGFSGSAFEFPKFGMPNFEMPKMEIPAAFREFAEKGVSQAKENYEKMKTAAE